MMDFQYVELTSLDEETRQRKDSVHFHKSTKYPHPFYTLTGGSAYQNHDGLHTVIIKLMWLIYNGSASPGASLDMNFRNNSRKKAIST